MPVRWISDFRARELHSKAQRLDQAGTRDEALQLYQRALELDPDRPTTLYNIGLIHKYRLNWRESLDFNARAYTLNPRDEATRWNYAIAATALRDWATARRLWKENGIEIEEGDGPIEMNFGITPLRLNANAEGEVVWGTRIDPARARIDSVPFADSGYRHGDIVLNDGAPVGYRMANGSKRPVFNVLQVFEPSAHDTYEIVIEAADAQTLEAAMKMAERLAVVAEDWTGNVRVLCRQCSEGLPHEGHDRELEREWRPERRIGVAVRDEREVRQLVESWRSERMPRVIENRLVLRSGAAAP